ncbi:MAG TPA: hypothetical protein VFP98_07760, partial [Candidatus Polarisedimenticolia bacterium]|nr:hypothetical protein [Candidatus Polarisedimenticolia bacterium]
MLHATLLAILVTLVSAATGSAGGAAAPATRPADVVPLYDGLGSYGRKVTTSSAEAQRYFDQGLKFLFAFNHDEAIRSFRRAAGIDPSSAMAWWGIAYANGPHINNPAVPVEREKAAWEALSRARQSLGGASDAESALVEALAARHSAIPPSDRKPLEQAYADAMRDVWKRFPEDLDIGAFFAEALMNLRPWDLWTVEGQPQPGTEEVTATLESILARRPDHALAAHLYIHAVEASMR